MNEKNYTKTDRNHKKIKVLGVPGGSKMRSWSPVGGVWAPLGTPRRPRDQKGSKTDFADPSPWSQTGHPNWRKIRPVATQTAMFLLTDRWVALGVILALILVPFWCPLALEKTVQSVQVSVFSSFGPLLDGDLFQDHFLDRF